jgi:hypothetical protein
MVLFSPRVRLKSELEAIRVPLLALPTIPENGIVQVIKSKSVPILTFLLQVVLQ